MRVLSLLLAAAAAAMPSFAEFTWENAKTGGGGGFVPGIVFHPTEKGLAYVRTDIGGIYKMNSDNSWTPITDSIADSDNWHNWYIDAFALDAQDPDIIYAAVGAYTNSWDPANGSIMKSTDRGSTWTFTDLPFKIGGNQAGRGTASRLSVDESDASVIYFGARSGNGLWRSTDAGASFEQVDSFTAVGTYIPDPSDSSGYNSDIVGLTFVTFDSTSGTTNGATSRIFVGTAESGATVYVSEDAGATWSAVEGQPTSYFPHKCRLQPEEKSLYLTYSDGAGPYDGTAGAVYRYDIPAGTWHDITPVSGDDLTYGFGGLGLDMLNPGTLVVASLNSWWPDAQIFRSTDSGSTWSPLWEWAAYPEMTYYYGISVENAPWIRKDFLDVDSKWLGWMIEAFEIDPLDSDHFLYGTGLTLYGGFDLTGWDTKHNISIQCLADGIEETSVQEVKSVPGGPELLAAVGDVSGFTWQTASDLQTPPQHAWDNPMFTTSSGVDWSGQNVDSVVRVGNTAGDYQVALSDDGGSSWHIDYATDQSKYGGSVAYSASGDAIVWSSSSNGVVVSKNQASFSAVSGLPTSAIVAADRVDNAYFYGGSGSTFYVSSNTGSSFSAGGSLSGASSVRDIETHPDNAGELYVSTNAGIFHSTDHGSSFTKLSGGLTDTYQIALGVGSSTDWNLYAFGTGSDGIRLYGSADGGSSWTNIQGEEQTFGAVSSCKLDGSGNVADMVYVGTNGRGVFYGKGTLSGGDGGSGGDDGGGGGSEPSTTLATVTKTTTSSGDAGPTGEDGGDGGGTAGHWAQCGGQGYSGPTKCESPWTCTVQNQWYSQCL